MISNSEFKIEIPNLNPLTPDYIAFWKEQKKRVLEGYWVSGKWMPGKLYFYINFAKIKRNVNKSLVKYLLNPELRDLEWEIFLLWTEARGFSGFKDDTQNTCNYVVSEYLEHELEPDDHIRLEYPEVLKPDGTFKNYIPPREYLRTIWEKPMGAPLFRNQNKNLLMLGSRGYGKDLAEDTIVYTKHGCIPIRDVAVGDLVANHLGQFVPVTNKFKFTDQLQYKITFKDGRTVECGGGHKWKVYLKPRFSTKNIKPYPSVLTTEEIIENLFNYRIYIKPAKPFKSFISKRCGLYSPYIEGYLCGRLKTYVAADPRNRPSYCREFVRGLIKGNGGNTIYARKEVLDKLKRFIIFAGYTFEEEDNRLTIIKDGNLQIVSIEPTIVKDSYCISVKGPDNLFLVNDLIPTHNSYSVAGIVSHEFLTDGKTSADEHDLSAASESMVMAGDAKYSSETLDKVRIMLNTLPGEAAVGDIVYPPPFYKRYRGSFRPGSEIIQKYRKKVAGAWVEVGSMSTIKHRTFKDSEFAGNGTRPGTVIMEEFGIFNNAEKALGSMVESQRDGAFKFGATFMIGTGGSMEAGAADAKKIFYSPDAYDCLTFEDSWEFRGKIGFFIPAYMGLNQFKDEEGNTDVERAKEYLLGVRERLSKSKGGSVMLEKEMINRPIVPSEMFLQNKGTMFPVVELQRALAELELETNQELDAIKVELFYTNSDNSYNGIGYAVDVKNKLTPIDQFPWTSDNKEGCVVIYEMPQLIDGKVPADTYIIGFDPVATDSEFGESLASIHVVKTKRHATKIGHDEIVATYFGRPYRGRNVVNEICLKLAIMYNAVVYFENAVGNVKEFFEKKHMLHYLASRPQTVLTKRASFEQAPTKEYGYPMSSRTFKLEGIAYLNDWLLEFRSKKDDRIFTNLDRIRCRYTLQQLIAFNMDGNFDAVMSLMGAIIGINERYNQFEEDLHKDEFEVKFYNELDRILVNNRKLFKTKVDE